MIKTEFKSRLVKYQPKSVDGRVVMVMSLVYTSTDKPIQDFLRALDDETGLTTMTSFIEPEWSKIEYKAKVNNLKMKFGGLENVIVDLVGIKVKFEETNDSICYKYELIFHKSLDGKVDLIMADNFLKRKEPNEDDKMVYVEYDTFIERY